MKEAFNHLSFMPEDETTAIFQPGNDLLNSVLSALQSEGFTVVLERVHESEADYYKLTMEDDDENPAVEKPEAVVIFWVSAPRESLVLKHMPGTPESKPSSRQRFEDYVMEAAHRKFQTMLRAQENRSGEAQRRLADCPWTQGVKAP